MNIAEEGNAKLTIEAPKYNGNLYDNILQTYTNLDPIEVQNVNRILQPVVKKEGGIIVFR